MHRLRSGLERKLQSREVPSRPFAAAPADTWPPVPRLLLVRGETFAEREEVRNEQGREGHVGEGCEGCVEGAARRAYKRSEQDGGGLGAFAAPKVQQVTQEAQRRRALRERAASCFSGPRLRIRCTPNRRWTSR